DQNNNSAGSSGAVYLYSRSGSSWSQQAYIKASNTEAIDRFSSAVSLSADGNTLAVGAYREDSNASGINGNQTDNSASASGAVYLYSRNGSSWSQQAYIKASNTEANDNFGTALSLSADGNTLGVGVYREDSNASGINGDQTDNSANSSGAVYLFIRSGSSWNQQAYIKASNTEANDYFGIALSLSADGNTLAVGAEREASNASGIDGDQNDNSVVASGAVYLYSRSGNSWSQQAYIKASNTEASDWFGSALSLSADGNTLAVGAYGEGSNASGINGDQSDNSAAQSGAVYLY
ncbi:Streptococcal hemagglutinin protein, partial [hydrothermal vent metagenome]